MLFACVVLFLLLFLSWFVSSFSAFRFSNISTKFINFLSSFSLCPSSCVAVGLCVQGSVCLSGTCLHCVLVHMCRVWVWHSDTAGECSVAVAYKNLSVEVWKAGKVREFSARIGLALTSMSLCSSLCYHISFVVFIWPLVNRSMFLNSAMWWVFLVILFFSFFILFLNFLRKISPELTSAAKRPFFAEEDWPWANIRAHLPLFYMWDAY